MKDKIRSILSRHQVLISNFGYLSVLQLVSILLPLATYPYLIRVLGAELWGKVVFAQTIAGFFVILINFGFDITATKSISVNREAPEKLSEIVSGVFFIKGLLFFLSLAILIFFIVLIPSFNEDYLLYLFSFGLCLNEWLFPIWYFQGIEKMKYITYINLTSRIIFFLLIFLFIHSQEDYLMVPLLNGIGALIGGGISLWIVFGLHAIRFKFPFFKSISNYFKETYPLFISRAIISVKDRFNVIFIGALLGNIDIAIYDLGIKILTLFSMLVDTANTVIFPKIAREQNMGFFTKIIGLLFIAVFVLIVFAQLFLHQLVFFLGGNVMMAGLSTIRIMLLGPLAFSIGIPLARNVMILFGKTKAFLISVSLTVIFYCALVSLVFLIPTFRRVEIFGIIAVLVYSFEAVYRLVYCKKNNLI